MDVFFAGMAKGMYLLQRGTLLAGLCVWSMWTTRLQAQGAEEAAATVAPFHLNIRYTNGQKGASARKADQARTNFKTVCVKLGNSLTAGSGIYGYGFARTFSCYDGQKMVYSNTDAAPSRWLLEIGDTKDKIELVLYYYYGKKAELRREIAKTVLPPTTNAMKIMRSRTVIDLLVLDLVSQTPLMRALDLIAEDKSFKARDRTASGGKERLPRPPVSFKIVKVVAKPDGSLETVPVGTAEQADESGDGDHIFRITLADHLDKADSYWAYNESGRSATRSAVRSMLEKKLAPFGLAWGKAAVGFANAFASGYVGARYGKSIMKGEALYSKSAMMGLFMEWRGGMLEGLRLYYDAAVPTKVKESGAEFHIKWSRPSLGMAFGHDLAGFIDRVDITPKIGIMHFDGRLPVASSFDPSVMIPTSFIVKSAASLGAELGLETHGFRNLTRLWGGCDFAGLGKADSYTSLRGGVDTYFDLIDFGSSDLSLLVFALGERISLTRKVDPAAEAATGTGQLLKELAYNLGYLGAGLTVSF